MHCPKCHAPMHTYNRNGVQIEQCSGCRGIFLDYGELETLTRLEAQWSQQAPPAAPAAPAWGAPHAGHHGGHGHHGHHHPRSFGRMLFSS
ncbi:zf-TFIIB domain-containing protein [Streptomyces sp. NPDC005012]|uniref:TFIIB-type zinc ribbon-containing protein n=1 Tax=unclassified Streptomyces TaxID=2593676 RepID=UPI0033B4170C